MSITVANTNDYVHFVDFNDLNAALSNDGETASTNDVPVVVHDVILPRHHPCSSHTLSLVAVSDSQAALKNSATFKRLHNSTMAKCSEFGMALHDLL